MLPKFSRKQKTSLKSYSVSSLRVAQQSERPKVSNAPTQTGIQESTLSNGVRLLSVDRASPVSTLSLFVKAGSRFETRSSTGATHFLKYFAGQNNAKKTGLRLVRDLEHFGSTMNVDIDREYISYNCAFSRFDGLELKIAAESLKFLLSPLLQEYEVDRLRELVGDDTHSLCETTRLLEAAHAVAYRDQGLGQPLYAPEYAVESIDGRGLGQPLYAPEYAVESIDGRGIHRHLSNTFVGSNMTLVATGMEHNAMQEVVSSLFSDVSLQGNFFEFARLGDLPADAPTSQTANFTSGESLNPSLGNSNVVLAYQGATRNSKNEAIFGLLRTYFNGLQLEGFASSSAHNFTYSDSGLFALQGSAQPGEARNVLSRLVAAIDQSASLSAEQFELLKTTAITQNLHTLSNVFSLAGHINKYGRLNCVPQYSSVTLPEFQAALRQLTKSTPSVVVASGDIRGINRL